ncbi:MAG: RNA polymerase sigma factor [Pseudonocardiaceae bacterium]
MTAASSCSEAWGLVEAAQRGDREAYGQLYSRYADGVSRFLSNRVRDRGLVEDLTNETFLRGWRRLDSVSDQGKDVGTWFTTIARNLVFDHAKSSRSKLDSPVAEVGDGHCEDRGPEQTVIERETAAELRRQVAQLPPDQRRSIYHRFFEDLSVSETAAVMGRNVGAVKALQHRGITKLRAAMTADPAPVPLPRDTVDQLVSAGDAVAQVHQLVAGDDHQVGECDRAQRLARWHTDDQTTARELDAAPRALTVGVA